MNCTFCKDRLADFLVDELPESEAVLVHEHLNICPDCRRRYNELKGTGKALEAIPTMRSVHGSDAFHKAVRESALLELNSMIKQLPPDQRRKVEARLENAKALYEDKKPELKPRRGRFWSTAAMVTLILGGLCYFFSGTPAPATPSRRDPVAAQPVLEPLKIAGEPRKREGGMDLTAPPAISESRMLAAPNNSAARFDLFNQGQVLLGPNSSANVPAAPNNRKFVISLESGELDIWRYECMPGAPLGANETPWQIETQYGTTEIMPGSRLSVGLGDYDQNDFEQPVGPVLPDSFTRVNPRAPAAEKTPPKRDDAVREAPRKEQADTAAPLVNSGRPTEAPVVRPLDPVNVPAPMPDTKGSKPMDM